LLIFSFLIVYFEFSFLVPVQPRYTRNLLDKHEFYTKNSNSEVVWLQTSVQTYILRKLDLTLNTNMHFLNINSVLN
jgi:hypothetical protein